MALEGVTKRTEHDDYSIGIYLHEPRMVTSVVYWPSTRPKMPFHRRGSCIFHWRGRAGLTIWDRVKIPRYSHRLMHRKRVTCELHDSYFLSMKIKHAIPETVEEHIPMASYGEILSGRELLYNWVHRKFDQFFGDQTSWWQDAVEKASTQHRAGPPGLRLSNPGERERNADGHKSEEVNMLQFYSVSNSLSHTTLSIKDCVAHLYCVVVIVSHAYVFV